MAKIIVFQHVPFEILGTMNSLFKQQAIRIKYVNFGRHPHLYPNIDGLIETNEEYISILKCLYIERSYLLETLKFDNHIDIEYKIKNQKRGNFIQINFSSLPKYLDNFAYNLKYDTNVLRFLIFNKK